jgi:hypothetical protein
VEGEWKESEFNRDGIDGGLKLRSPSKITLDMSACMSDSKVKRFILLKIFKDIRFKILR